MRRRKKRRRRRRVRLPGEVFIPCSGGATLGGCFLRVRGLINKPLMRSSNSLLLSLCIVAIVLATLLAASPSIQGERREVSGFSASNELPTTTTTTSSESNHSSRVAQLASSGGSQHKSPRFVRGEPPPPPLSWPLLVVAAKQPVELACHAFGRALTLAPDPSAPGNFRWLEKDEPGDANDAIRHDKQPDGADDEPSAAALQSPSVASPQRQPEAEQLTYRRRHSAAAAAAADDEEDLVSLVFWYKDDNPTPIYTLDARQAAETLSEEANLSRGFGRLAGGRLADADKNADKSSASWPGGVGQSYDDHRSSANNRRLLASSRHYPATGELSMDAVSEFPLIKLRLSGGARAAHSGAYRCRVDFRRSPTVSQTVRLLVQVPLSRLQISATGATSAQLVARKPISALRYTGGQQVAFTCLAFNGSPRPKLEWLISWPTRTANNVGNWSLGQVISAPQQVAELGAKLEDALTADELAAALKTTISSSAAAAADQPENVQVQVDLAADQLPVELSRLSIAKLDRRFQGARIGCRARQQLLAQVQVAGDQLAARNSAGTAVAAALPNYRKSSSAPDVGNHRLESLSANLDPKQQQQAVAGEAVSANPLAQARWPGKMIDEQSANNGAEQLVELTDWLELRLNLPPIGLEIVSSSSGDQRAAHVKPPEPGTTGSNLWLVEVEEGSKVRLTCRSWGSHPAARLRWNWLRLDGRQVNQSASGNGSGAQSDEQVSLAARQMNAHLASGGSFGGGGGSNSSLDLELGLVGAREHLAELSCEATNEALKDSWTVERQQVNHLTARVRLIVSFSPVVRLLEWPPAANEVSQQLSSNLSSKGNSMKRQMKCLVQSNPPINQLVWLVNGRPLAKIMATPDRRQQQQPVVEANAQLEPVAPVSGASAPVERPLEPPVGSLGGGGGGNNGDDGLANQDEHDPNELLNWRLEPLAGKLIGDSHKYEMLAANRLLINDDDQDEYQCIVTNKLGQSASAKLRPKLQYPPLCQPSTAAAAGSGRAQAAFLGLDPTDAHVLQVSAGQMNLTCPVEARPLPVSTQWAFVPLQQLASALTEARNVPSASSSSSASSIDDLLERLFESPGAVHLESAGSWLASEQVRRLTQKQQHGLLLCRALNQLGRQRRPCLNLLLPPDLAEPSAANCTIEPLVLLEGDLQRIAISLDCSATTNSDKLLFQLAVSSAANKRDGAPSTVQANNKRLLFTRLDERQKPRFAISELLQLPLSPTFISASTSTSTSNLDPQALNDQASGGSGPTQSEDAREVEEQGNDSERKIASASQQLRSTSSLTDQVSLLSELVFTIRASNLLETSEPHAIYGSELRLRRNDHQSLNASPNSTNDWRLASAPVQVSRSTTNELSELEATGLPLTNLGQPVQSPRRQVGTSSGSIANSRTGGSGTGGSSFGWAQQQEYGIVIAATCATLLLSLLTLTLIILLLKHRRAEPKVKSASQSHRFKLCRRRRDSQSSQSPSENPAAQAMHTSDPANQLELVEAPAELWSNHATIEPYLAKPISFLSAPVRHLSQTSLAEQSSGNHLLYATTDFRTGRGGSASLLSLANGNQVPRTLQYDSPAVIELKGGAHDALYVIGGGDCDVEQQAVELEDCSLSTALRDSSHLCGLADTTSERLVAAHQVGEHHNQLVSSYCSPQGTCASSSYCEEHSPAASTLTSSEQALGTSYVLLTRDEDHHLHQQVVALVGARQQQQQRHLRHHQKKRSTPEVGLQSSSDLGGTDGSLINDNVEQLGGGGALDRIGTGTGLGTAHDGVHLFSFL